MSFLKQKLSSRRRGFTIVELLIVIVVIAILAAISIVAYNGIQNRAADTAVQSDLRQFAQQASLYTADKGIYPVSLSSFAPFGGIKVSKESYDTTGIHTYGNYNFLYCKSDVNPTEFGLLAKSRSGKSFQYVGGAVSEFTGFEPGGADTLCRRIRVIADLAGSRSWLYSVGSWQSTVGS